MIRSIYPDTSIFGGYFEQEFSTATIQLFERIRKEEINVLISEILVAALHNAPEHVRALIYEIPDHQKTLVELSRSAEELAKKYISEKVVGKTSLADCLHIALATVHQVDILASWNFKHIVNIERIRGYNSVNLKLGYNQIEIRSPLEMKRYESGKN